MVIQRNADFGIVQLLKLGEQIQKESIKRKLCSEMMPSIGYNVMKNIYFRLQLLSGVSCKPQCESNIVNWIKFNQIVRLQTNKLDTFF